MFIRTAKIKNDEIVYLVEGFRDQNGKSQQRIIKKYGLLSELKKDDPNIMEKLKKQATEMDPISIVNLQINMDTLNNQASKSLNYGYYFLNSIYDSLKIPSFISNHTRKYNNQYNVNHTAKLLVYSRILKPESKKATYENKDRYFNLDFDFSLDDVYRSLSIMNNFKEDLEVWIHNQIKTQIGRDTSLVFYDVTNYYFETEIQDDDEVDDDGNISKSGLRRKGVSKEHRPQPIVQMGMFIDKNGIPIAYKLFPGNTNDKVTLLPVLEEMKAKYKLGRVIVVADKGLNSGKNLLYIKQNGNGYIVAQQIRKRKKELIDRVLDEEGYVYKESGKFKMKSWIEEKHVKDEKGTTHILKEKVVCFWSKDYEDREKRKREKLEEQIRKFKDKPSLYTASNSFGVKKYLKEKHVDKHTGEVMKKNPHLEFDEDKYKRDCQLDGYYLLVTSELDLSDEEIIDRYNGLWRLEESFRIIKSDLQGRPVYVRTKEHIEAHFLICYISLVIMRILQFKLDYKYTAEAIQNALNNATCKLIDKEIYSLEPHDKVFKEIEKAYNVSLDRAYVRNSELKDYKRRIKIK